MVQDAGKLRQWHRKQRAARLLKEIALLEAMDSSVWKKALVCGLASFAAIVAGVYFMADYAISQSAASHPSHLMVLLCCALLVLILYAFFRYPMFAFSVFVTLTIGLVFAVLFEDVPTSCTSDFGGSDSLIDVGPARENRKVLLQRRIQRAIEKRKLLLRKLA